MIDELNYVTSDDVESTEEFPGEDTGGEFSEAEETWDEVTEEEDDPMEPGQEYDDAEADAEGELVSDQWGLSDAVTAYGLFCVMERIWGKIQEIQTEIGNIRDAINGKGQLIKLS